MKLNGFAFCILENRKYSTGKAFKYIKVINTYINKLLR